MGESEGGLRFARKWRFLEAVLTELQAVLNKIFQTMLGESGELIGVGQALAGLGALVYIAYRVWGHMARAEDGRVVGVRVTGLDG